MRDVCDNCERTDVDVVFVVDTIERGEGFSACVCASCRDELVAELGTDDTAASYVERVEPIGDAR